MGRGQYDRVAARANRPAITHHGMAEYLRGAVVILDAAGQPVTQEQYEALVVERDKLLRLCKTHGLFV